MDLGSESTAATPQTPAWRLDPVIVAVVAFAVYVVHGYQGVLGTDLGTFVYGGEHVARGTPSYDGIFNSVGPLSDALPGLAIWAGHLVGLGPVFASRAAFTVVSALCPAAVCLVAQRAFASRSAGWLAAAVFLTFGEFIDLATNGPREKTPMVLFATLALLMMLHRRWASAGVLTALATLTWQPSLLPLVVAASIGIGLSGAGRVGRAVRFIVGGAVPTGLMSCWFVLTGTFGLAVQGFVVINVGYTQQPSVFDRVHPLWPLLEGDYGASLWLLLAGLMALLPLAVAALRPLGGLRLGPDVDRSGVLLLAGGGVTAVAWTCYAINGTPDLFVLLPFGAVGLAGLWRVLVIGSGPRSWTARPGPRGASRGSLLCAALCAVAVLAAFLSSVTSGNDELLLERRDINRVLGAGPPGATVLSLHAPEVLALTQTTNPSRYQLFSHTMTAYLDAHLDGGLAGYARQISRTRPTFLVVGLRADITWARDVLHRDYRKVGAGPDWTWYVDRALGASVAHRLRKVNAEVMRAGSSRAAVSLPGSSPSVLRTPPRSARRRP